MGDTRDRPPEVMRALWMAWIEAIRSAKDARDRYNSAGSIIVRANTEAVAAAAKEAKLGGAVATITRAWASGLAFPEEAVAVLARDRAGEWEVCPSCNGVGCAGCERSGWVALQTRLIDSRD